MRLPEGPSRLSKTRPQPGQLVLSVFSSMISDRAEGTSSGFYFSRRIEVKELGSLLQVRLEPVSSGEI